jgi:hypothetical protein
VSEYDTGPEMRKLSDRNAELERDLAAAVRERDEVRAEYVKLESEWQADRAESASVKAEMGRELSVLKAGVREAYLILEGDEDCDLRVAKMLRKLVEVKP